MNNNTTGRVLISGALRSIADGGIVAYTGDIYDPDLQMTQREINKLEGGIHDDYGWTVVNKSEYDNIPHLNKMLYFIIDDDQPVETNTRLSGNTLFIDGAYSTTVLNISGTLSNNTLTLL